jgi:small subunit ribosomal protein S20
MANLRSSKKDLKRSEKKRVANQSVRTSLKTFIKKTRSAVAAGEPEATKEALTQAVSAIDKAVQRGVIHKNQAARRKSRIAKAAAAPLGSAPKATKAKAKTSKAKPRAKTASKAAKKK